MNTNTLEKGIFRPEAKFGIKYYAVVATGIIFVSSLILAFATFIGWTSTLEDSGSDSSFSRFINDNGGTILTVYLTVVLIILILAFILSLYYAKNIEYEIKSQEIIVKKGILNKTVKHIPFRTITNVSSRYGPYDRLFGIGTVEIETAGKSGQQTGPEAKIEGIKNFEEIRDVILSELRKFKGQYTTTTETNTTEDQPEQNYLVEILKELRTIKEILSK